MSKGSELRSHVHERVGRLIEEILQASDTLEGLSALLGTHGDLPRSSAPGALRSAAAGVRAIATQAQLTATALAGVAARLEAYASLPDGE